MSCRSLGTALLLALVLVFSLGAATTFKRSPKKNSPAVIAGLKGTDGNEETVQAIFALTELANIPNYDRRYFSSTGDDANAPCTDSANPCQTLHQLDTIVEGTCNVIAVMDGDGVWDTLAEVGASFDGGIGPPPVGCGSHASPAFFVISDEAKTDPFNIDCTNMTDAMREQDAGSNGLFFGREGGAGASDNSGWIAVSNIHIDNCPSPTPQIAGGNFQDIFRGNVLTLNLTVVDLVGHNRQLYSGKGSAGIHLNTAWNHLDAATFDGDCVGVSDPYVCCTGAGDCEMDTQLMMNIGGAGVLIADQTYNWANTQPDDDSGVGALIGVTNAGDLTVIGPNLANTVTTDDVVNALHIPCKTSGAQVDYSFAYMDIVDFNQSGEIVVEAVTGAHAACQNDISFYEVFLNKLGYIGFNHPGTLTSQTALNTLSFNCSHLLEELAALGYLFSFQDANGVTAGNLDLTAKGSHIGAALDANADLYLAANADTHAAFRILVDAQPEISCDGNEDCSDGWFEESDGVDPLVCRVSQVITLPTVEAGDSAGTSHDAWIPAYVLGAEVRSFTFGADL